MKHFRFSLILLLLSACSMPVSQSKQDPAAISTSAALTVQAILPAATQPLPAQPLATQSLPVTQTLPPATETPKSKCQDSALNTAWMRDKEVYDVKAVNKPLAPNAPFVISWTFQNTGACTWDETYLMYFESGTSMTQSPGYPVVQVGQTVAPGQSVTVDVGMTAPGKMGDYQASWRLQNNQGETLMTFGVIIKVGSGATKAPARASNLRYTYDCTSGMVKISLSWADAASDEDGYRVYRDGALLKELAADSTSYDDIAPGVGTYNYVVAAFNAIGESPAKVSATTTNCQ
jgi:hypothetical protein